MELVLEASRQVLVVRSGHHCKPSWVETLRDELLSGGDKNDGPPDETWESCWSPPTASKPAPIGRRWPS